MELTMVLRANSVAQSRTVDWLSNTPWVSISTTATCTEQALTATLKGELTEQPEP